MSYLPICDNCIFAEDQGVEINEKQNISLNKIIKFPEKRE
jgi:hypothetical protein